MLMVQGKVNSCSWLKVCYEREAEVHSVLQPDGGIANFAVYQ